MVVEHHAHDYHLACFRWLETEAATETMKSLFCHTDTPFYSCSCRAVGEVVVSLLTSRWVEEGCHQPGPKHVSAIPKDEAIQPGSVSLEVREER